MILFPTKWKVLVLSTTVLWEHRLFHKMRTCTRTLQENIEEEKHLKRKHNKSMLKDTWLSVPIVLGALYISFWISNEFSNLAWNSLEIGWLELFLISAKCCQWHDFFNEQILLIEYVFTSLTTQYYRLSSSRGRDFNSLTLSPFSQSWRRVL